MKDRKKNHQSKIIFILDSIRIGGVERLCFDECYELMDRQIEHEIVCLTDSIFPEESILQIDEKYYKSKKIKLSFLGENRFQQITNLKQILNQNTGKDIKIISHSTRGSVIARISTLIIFKKVHITLFIHQLINLSDTKQKIKRIVHSLFADEVTTSSAQFKFSWEEYIASKILLRIFYRKHIKFNRMGVYLPRLRDSVKMEISECSQNSLHLLFMSRITAWKGYPIFSNICTLMKPNKTHSIVISNENSRKQIFQKEGYLTDSNHYLPNNGVANINFPFDVIHIYPTNYGAGIGFPQSIGMNVLECLAVGIPSLISHDDFETWPEFESSPLIRIVDWQDESESLRIIEQFVSLSKEAKMESLILVENAISITKHVNQFLKN